MMVGWLVYTTRFTNLFGITITTVQYRRHLPTCLIKFIGLLTHNTIGSTKRVVQIFKVEYSLIRRQAVQIQNLASKLKQHSTVQYSDI